MLSSKKSAKPTSDQLTVTVLGCSGTYASADNPCSGYLVQSSQANVLLDCGPGTLGPLQKNIDLTALTAILITHCHPDHWLELPVMRNVFTWFVPREIPVYGTQQTHDMDAAMLSVKASHSNRRDPLHWNVISHDSTLQIGDQSWSFATTDHPVETLAMRVDCDGRSAAFSSDTGPAWDFRTLGEGIHTALCDASHPSSYEDQGSPHMSARQAAGAAAAANIERLILTHIAPGIDPQAQLAEAQEVFNGNVDVAFAGMVFNP